MDVDAFLKEMYGESAMHAGRPATPTPPPSTLPAPPAGAPIRIPTTVAEYASALLPWLGAGLYGLMTLAAPPTFHCRDGFRVLTAEQVEAMRVAATDAGDGSGVASSGRRAVTGPIPIATPVGLVSSRSATLRGAFLRSSDGAFVRALLCIPAHRLVNDATLHALTFHTFPPPPARTAGPGAAARGRESDRDRRPDDGDGEEAERGGGSEDDDDLEIQEEGEAAGTGAAIRRRPGPAPAAVDRGAGVGAEVRAVPMRLLPGLQLPTFDHFFAQPHEPPPPPIRWPLSWVQYHATAAVLVVEECRAMCASELAGAAKSVARAIRRHGGGGGGGRRNGGWVPSFTAAVAQASGLSVGMRPWNRDAPPLPSALSPDSIEGGAEYAVTVTVSARDAAAWIVTGGKRGGDATRSSRMNARGDGVDAAAAGGSGGGGGGGGATDSLVHTTGGDMARARRGRVWNARDLVLLTVTTVGGRAVEATSLSQLSCLGMVVSCQPGGPPPDDRRRDRPPTSTDGRSSPADAHAAFTVVVRVCPDAWMVTKLASRSCALTITGVTSSATATQAYQSIATINYTPFAAAVLAPSAAIMHPALRMPPVAGTPAPLQPPPPDLLPPALFAALRAAFDDSQMRVILVAATGGAYRMGACRIDSSTGGIVPTVTSPNAGIEVTTIIGPPGTGKTRTILGILSALRAVLRTVPSHQGSILPTPWVPVHSDDASLRRLPGLLPPPPILPQHGMPVASRGGSPARAATPDLATRSTPVLSTPASPVQDARPHRDQAAAGEPAPAAPSSWSSLAPRAPSAPVARDAISPPPPPLEPVISGGNDDDDSDVIIITDSESDGDSVSGMGLAIRSGMQRVESSAHSGGAGMHAATRVAGTTAGAEHSEPEVARQMSQSSASDDDGDDEAGLGMAVDLHSLRMRQARDVATHAVKSATAPAGLPSVGDKRTRVPAVAAGGGGGAGDRGAPADAAAHAKRARLDMTADVGHDASRVAAGAGSNPALTPPPRHCRFLVCTPSNAACDEIVSRLMAEAVASHGSASNTNDESLPATDGGGGLLDCDGKRLLPKVVRIGAGAAATGRRAVWDCTAEVLSFRRMRELTLARVKAEGLSLLRPGEKQLSRCPAVLAIDAQLEDLASATGWSYAALTRVPRHATWPSKLGDHAFLSTTPAAGSPPARVAARDSGGGGGGEWSGGAVAGALHMSTSPPAALPPLLRSSSTMSMSGASERAIARRRAMGLKVERDELQWRDAFARALAALKLDRAALSALYHAAYAQVLSEADVVATTLAGSASIHHVRGLPRLLLDTAPDLVRILGPHDDLSSGPGGQVGRSHARRPPPVCTPCVCPLAHRRLTWTCRLMALSSMKRGRQWKRRLSSPSDTLSRGT